MITPTQEISSQKTESRLKKVLKLLLKVAITVLCFWYISTKIDFQHAFQVLKKASWLLLFVAVLVYVLSKIVASYRLMIYFKNIELYISHWNNLKLYWLGMFYNLFLPGSISGDAYKVILLSKKRHASYKKTASAVLLDRFSGLLGLGILVCGYGAIVLEKKEIAILLIIGCIASVFIFYIIIRKFFPVFLSSYWSTLFLGLLVQAIQAAGLYFILLAIHIPLNQKWIFIFLAASVVSVLPLSLGGGLGTREVVFAEGATYFHLDPQTGVIISLLFYLSSVAGSLPGAFFIFHDPLPNQ